MDLVMDTTHIALMIAFFGATAELIHFCAALMDKGGKS
jgi:hypothetical protein